MQIRQAGKSDTSDIAELISHSRFIHRHLDWQGVLDWLPYEPFFIVENDKKLLGLLACPSDPESVAWIRCFACASNHDPAPIWEQLLKAVITSPGLAHSTLYAVSLHDWFSELLSNSNFSHFQNIVILKWKGQLPHPQPLNSSILIRPMEASDINSVAELDRLAFEKMWVNTSDKITLAFNQAEHASVAEMEGRVIGYELSTANHFSAHLARIAIHPDNQRSYVGSNLILEMFKYFLRRGINQITVNTQDNNFSSLSLYQRCGFLQTGESLPVFCFPLG
ncbi:MAG: GNAT family N-acetyltransferase [Chloroflexi bacterium]|nr:GNAT family N-acetyltransferase [Chloroflexota bacterium]